jgi:hypothetical protein
VQKDLANANPSTQSVMPCGAAHLTLRSASGLPGHGPVVKELVPTAAVIVYLVNQSNPAAAYYAKDAEGWRAGRRG